MNRIRKEKKRKDELTSPLKERFYNTILTMTKETAIKLFEQKQIRTQWDEEQEKWYFSIVDIIEVLTGTDRPRKYWSDLKRKVANCPKKSDS